MCAGGRGESLQFLAPQGFVCISFTTSHKEYLSFQLSPDAGSFTEPDLATIRGPWFFFTHRGTREITKCFSSSAQPVRRSVIRKGSELAPFVSGSLVLPSARRRRVLRDSSLSGRTLSSPVCSQGEETKLSNLYLKQEQALQLLASGHSPR